MSTWNDLIGHTLVSLLQNQYRTAIDLKTERGGTSYQFRISPQTPSRFRNAIAHGTYDMDNLITTLGDIKGAITDVEMVKHNSVELGKVLGFTWTGLPTNTRPWLHEDREVYKLKDSNGGEILICGVLWEYESMGQAKVCYTSVSITQLEE